MKVQVITLRSKKLDSGEYEVAEQYSSIYRDEVACLYQDRNGVQILLKKGTLVKVKHSLKEMENYLGLGWEFLRVNCFISVSET